MATDSIYRGKVYEAAVAMTQAEIERGFLPTSDAVCSFFDAVLDKLIEARGEAVPYDEYGKYDRPCSNPFD